MIIVETILFILGFICCGAFLFIGPIAAMITLMSFSRASRRFEKDLENGRQ